MTGPIEGYITLQAAADMLGLSRQTLYRRLSIGQTADSNGQSTDNSGQSTDNRPSSIVQGKKRYVSMDWIRALMEAEQPDTTAAEDGADSPTSAHGQTTDSGVQYMDSSADTRPGTAKAALQRIRALERALMEAQGKLAVLEATNSALQAHIDNLKNLLDREQAIRMAAEQRKLPAGQGGLFAWIRGRGKKHDDR